METATTLNEPHDLSGWARAYSFADAENLRRAFAADLAEMLSRAGRR